MTNHELFKELKETREELREEMKALREEHKQLHKDFYLFKGKSFGFIGLLTFVINFAMQFWHKK
ncbi:MAG: hypothetical protein V2I33_07110 [Kangiellaceae bacterium]|jgi:hypothetical protein|nr:hypothetical protein [Kangiellaceae bacterium]